MAAKRVTPKLPPALRNILAAGVCLVASLTRAEAPQAYAGPEGVTAVSVHGRDVTVDQAYEMLSKAAGVRIRADRGETQHTKRISFAVVSEPFWVALQRINEKSGMHLSGVAQDDVPAVDVLSNSIVSTHRTIATAMDGPFLAVLSEPADQRGRPHTALATAVLDNQLTLRVWPDPRLKAMMLQGGVKVDEAIDESGRAIKSWANARSSQFQDGGVSVDVNLAARAAPRRVGRLKLSSKMMVATRWEVVECSGLTSERPSTTYGAGFRIVSRSAPHGDVRHVTVELTRTGHVAPPWLKEPTRVVLLKPKVLDARNRLLQTSLFDADWFGKMFRIEVETAQPAVATGQSKLGDPERLTMEIPTDVAYYDLHWEFRDLALR